MSPTSAYEAGTRRPAINPMRCGWCGRDSEESRPWATFQQWGPARSPHALRVAPEVWASVRASKVDASEKPAKCAPGDNQAPRSGSDRSYLLPNPGGPVVSFHRVIVRALSKVRNGEKTRRIAPCPNSYSGHARREALFPVTPSWNGITETVSSVSLIRGRTICFSGPATRLTVIRPPTFCSLRVSEA